MVVRRMMRHVMTAKKLPPARRGNKVMNEVVRTIIEEVPHDEARKEWLADGRAQGEHEEHIKYHGKRATREQRHHEAVLVAWVLMMHPVKQKMQPLAPVRVVRPVKDVPMQNVFGQSPSEHSAQMKHHNRDRREFVPERAPDQEEQDDRDPRNKGRCWVNPREALEKVAFKHSARLRTPAFILRGSRGGRQ